MASSRLTIRMRDAFILVQAGTVPYTAAKRAGVSVRGLYASKLYKLWKSGTREDLRALREALADTKPLINVDPIVPPHD